MFNESNLHSLIARESQQRRIPRGKLIRESLNAAADDRFAVSSDSGLSPDWREKLRRLAALAEAQDDWGWWRKPPWSELKLLLVRDADYLKWLDGVAVVVSPVASNARSGNQTVSHRDHWQRTLAEKALKAIYPHGVPDRTGKTNAQLCGEVEDWLNEDRNWSPGETKRKVSRDSILRAAGRRCDKR